MGARINDVVAGLAAYLVSDDVRSEYTDLASVGVEAFNRPVVNQWPRMSIYPVAQRMIDAENFGTLSEHENGTIEVKLTDKSENFHLMVKKMFDIVDALRRAINQNQAGIQAGVNWIALVSSDKFGPDSDYGDGFYSLFSTVSVQYSIEAK